MPAVTLQVRPFPAGGHDVGGTLMILRLAERDVPDVVYVEQLTGDRGDLRRQAGRSRLPPGRDEPARPTALAPAATASFLAGMLREI